MTALRELAEARDILDAFLLEHEGEETPEIAALWEQLEGETTEKIERWGLWILDKSGDAKKLKEEESRVSARRKAIENAVERSKSELKLQMERLGKTKVNGLLATIAIQTNPPAVTSTLTDEQMQTLWQGGSEVIVQVPASYRVDRAIVLASEKQGAPIPEGIAVERGSHVRIR